MYINVLEVSNGANGNVVTLRNEDYTSSRPSTSSANSSSSHSMYPVNNCASYTNEADFHNSLEAYINGCRSSPAYASDSDSNCEYHFTPVKKTRAEISEIDSGFATGPCSSSSVNKRNHPSCSTRASNGAYNDRTSDDEYGYESFKKRVKKARMNIRKQICGDSDSN